MRPSAHSRESSAAALAGLVALIDNQHQKRSTGDGLTDAEYFLGTAALPPAVTAAQSRSFIARLYTTFRSGVQRLASSKEDTEALLAVIETAAGQLMGHPQDDRTMMLEKIVTSLSLQRPDSRTAALITNGLIGILYNDLDHPPRSIISSAHAFRSIDGSGNCVTNHALGAGFTPFARSVSAMTPASGARPDPGLVFDLLLRRDVAKTHPAKISSLLFAMANIITHDILQAKPGEPEINQQSSYLDLQVIYGKTAEEHARVRTGVDGLIHPDTFADSRIAMMPPATAALVVLFSRHHNFIAQRVRAINERGTYRSEAQLRADAALWQRAEAQVERLAAAQKANEHEVEAGTQSSPASSPEHALTVAETVNVLVQGALKAQDEEIFGRSRVINCGFFVACILRDYIPAILNQTANGWYLDPLREFHNAGPKVPRGAGNHVSAEFSILYRWHAAISSADEEWLNEISEEAWPGIRPEDLTPAEFAQGAARIRSKIGNLAKPHEWTPHGWKRDSKTGKFDDWKLAETILRAIKEPACALGARNTPAWMRIIDIMGQETARNKWGLCSLNEFRRFLGLKTYASFEEWNDDPEISGAAEMLYSHIDNLELFPGLQAEQTKEAGPGAGLCPGYTTSRAILSDATALVRGDRFLTIDLSPTTCTSWGYEYGQTSQAGAYNGIIGKLFFNTLPNIFTYNSTWALFPFVTRNKIEDILKKKGVFEKYNSDEPTGQLQDWYGVNSYKAVTKVLTEPANFGVPYEQAIRIVASGQSYIMAKDNINEHGRDKDIIMDLAYPRGWQRTFDNFFRVHSARLLRERSMQYHSGQRLVDVVKEVCNVVPMLYAAQRFGLMLRDPGEELGFSVQELTQQLQAQFALIFDVSYSFSGGSHWEAREASKLTGQLIGKQIGLRWRATGSSGGRFLTNTVARVSEVFGGVDEIRPSEECVEMYRKLHEAGYSMEDAVSYVHGLCVSSVPTISHSASLLVEFYLREENAEHKDAIVELCERLNRDRKDAQASELLRGYVREQMRLCGMAPIIPRTVVADRVEVEDNGEIKVFKKGDGIMSSQKAANLDPEIFENPTEVNPSRPKSAKALNFGTGMHECLGAQMAMIALPAILRAVFSLPNVRLAPGKAGQFETFANVVPGGTTVQTFVTPTGREWPFATNLKIIFDDVPASTSAAGGSGFGDGQSASGGTTSSAYVRNRGNGPTRASGSGTMPRQRQSLASRAGSLRSRFRTSGSARSGYFDRLPIPTQPEMTKSYSASDVRND